jgi:hypothetical protein
MNSRSSVGGCSRVTQLAPHAGAPMQLRDDADEHRPAENERAPVVGILKRTARWMTSAHAGS